MEIKKVPPKVFESALARVAARLEMPEFVQRMSLRLAIVLAIVVLVQGIAIWMMLPLKERVPYFIEARKSGEVVISKDVATRFTIGERHIAYFIWHDFIVRLLTIDDQTLERLPYVMEIVKGAAKNQVVEFVNAENIGARIKEDPTLRRYVTLEGKMEFLKSDSVSGSVVMWMTVKTQSKSGSTSTRIRARVDYIILPVESDEQALKNPIGLYVTSFRFENA